MKKLLLAAVATLGLCSAAQADVVLGGQTFTGPSVDNLTLTAVVPGGNQPQNIQCVICGDNQPQQQLDFGYSNFKNSGSLTNIQEFSTNVSKGGDAGFNTIGLPYDGSFLRAYLLANGDGTLNFTVGIDINDNGNAQTLNSFYLLNLTQKTILSEFTTPTQLPNQNNGTGFPDYTLGTFNISLGTDINPGDQLIFFANMSGLNDGPDSFFIQAAPVPGPIVGAGIPGLVFALGGMIGLNRFRRKRQVV